MLSMSSKNLLYLAKYYLKKNVILNNQSFPKTNSLITVLPLSRSPSSQERRRAYNPP